MGSSVYRTSTSSIYLDNDLSEYLAEVESKRLLETPIN